MNWKNTVPLFFLLFILLLPIQALAVDFTISEVKIETHLQPNGDATVIEKHTYVFDSEFNGITRDLIAKKGTSITDFVAFENDEPLKVEEEKGHYKVFRAGKNEVIEIEMHYRILNGVEKYKDGAQFYWPFFDDRNETDYERMNVEVYPPSAAKEVLFLGYDAAYKKGMIGSGGAVAFGMGEVSAGENGDIRIVYEPSLFPNVVERKGTIRDEVIAEENRLADEEMAYIVTKDKTENYGVVGITAIGAILLVTFGRMLALRSRHKRETVALKLMSNVIIVPKEKMSIPATIYYTKSGVLSPEATAAALLDLVRQGKLKQLPDDKFELIDRNVKHTHEKALMKLLFDNIGDGVHFDIADLETFTKNKKNHDSYRKSLASWRLGIVEEVKQQHLFEQKTGTRWLLAIIGLVLAVGAVQFARYELFVFMATAIVLTLVTWLCAALYKPRSLDGHIIIEEWKQLQKAMDNIDLDEWKGLSTDDKFRAYTYAIGVKDKTLASHFTEFTDAENRITSTGPSASGVYYFNPVYISSSFNSANTNASVDASGSSTSSSSGGGTGGGGGGSGAF